MGGGLTLAEDRPECPAIAGARKTESADGVRERRVPKLKGAGDGVREEEESRREEEQAGVAVARCSCALRGGQNRGRKRPKGGTYHYEDSGLPVEYIGIVFRTGSVDVLLNDESECIACNLDTDEWIDVLRLCHK